MTSFNDPTNATSRVNVLSILRALIASLAKMDYSSDTNIPTGTIRWDSSTKKFQSWNGSSWVDLTVNFGDNVYVSKSGSAGVTADGSSSGSTAGALFDVRNGGTTVLALGNWSAVVGGAYNASGLLWSVNELRFVTNGGTNERMRIASGGNTYFPGVGTTASGANAFLNSGSSPANELLRSTSSIRYKRDVEDIDDAAVDRFVEHARAVWYRSKAVCDPTEWSFYGLIAEEMAAIEPRLVHWGYRDEDYEEVLVGHALADPVEVEKEDGTKEVVRPLLLDGEGNPVPVTERRLKAGAEKVPDAVQYDRVSVLLLNKVQRQQRQIDALEARLAALEARFGGA